MKTNYQTQKMKLFLLSILFVMLLQSCTKDNKCSDSKDVIINYNIADSNKAKIPYTGTDTLVFISDKGDTAALIGQGKKTIFNQIIKTVNDDCTKSTIYNYEKMDINFIGENILFNKILYRVAKTSFDPIGLTGLEIYFNDNYRVGSTIEYVFYNMNIEDSIKINGNYISGGFIDNEKKILYNMQFGLLKLNFSNLTWTRNK